MSKIVRDCTISATIDGPACKRSPIASAILAALALCAAMPVSTTAARADIIQIPAIAFVNRATISSANVIGEASGGTLTTGAGTYYAAVPFQADGGIVCKFTLVHRDNDGDNEIIARLMKKKIIVGSNPFTDGLQQMARITTSGSVSGVTKKSDTIIKQAAIEPSKAFYYVELTLEANTIEVLGVLIEFGPTC